jgi:hypothetical protein
LSKDPIRYRAKLANLKDPAGAGALTHVNHDNDLHRSAYLRSQDGAVCIFLSPRKKKLQSRDCIDGAARVEGRQSRMTRCTHINERLCCLRIANLSENYPIHRHAHARSNTLGWRHFSGSF